MYRKTHWYKKKFDNQMFKKISNVVTLLSVHSYFISLHIAYPIKIFNHHLKQLLHRKIWAEVY